jgi:hypothetical protein
LMVCLVQIWEDQLEIAEASVGGEDREHSTGIDAICPVSECCLTCLSTAP